MGHQLYELFAKNKGYLTSKLIHRNRSLYYQLKAMLEAGKVMQIKRGLYRHVDFAEEANWGEVCKSAPQAVLCLFSAWQIYDLATTISPFVHIAIPVRKKPVLSDFPPTKIYFWSADYYEIGKVLTTFNEEGISVYDIEKSVCDAIRYRNKVGTDITSEVLKNYLKRTDRNLDKLMKYAERMRLATVLSNYLTMML
jgi:predicted transcriptional regulator of viral defense system